MRCDVVAKSVQASLLACRYCQRHRVVRTPAPTLSRRTPVNVNDSRPVVPDAGNVIDRAATSPRGLPTSARTSNRSSQTMNPRQPPGPGDGYASASSARTSIVDGAGPVRESWTLIVKVLPATAALAYAAGESSGVTLRPRRHSGTVTSWVAFRRIVRASPVAAELS